jgi:putative ABC transport system permease protein
MFSPLLIALRGLARRPGATAATVLTLALGMAATITFFGLMDWLLFRPVPGVRDAERVAQVRFTTDGSSMGFGALSISIAMSTPTFEELASSLTTVRDVAAVTRSTVNLGADDDLLAERAAGAMVSGAYFSALGVTPARGRLIGPADAARGAPPAAVISDHLWRERFGAGDTVGRMLRVGGQPFTIIGIGAPGFRGEALNEPVDVWLPLNEHGVVAVGMTLADLTERSAPAVQRVIARAPAGVPADELASALRTEVSQVMARLAATYPEAYRSRWDVTVDIGLGIPEPLRTDVRRNGVIITAFVFLVLLVACANAAYMLLARSVERRHEIAVRRALGAGTFRLFRQLLGESVLIAALAGGLGALIAAWSIDLLEGVRLMPALPPVADLRLDARVAAFTAALIVFTALIFGAAPAWFTMAVDPGESFRGGAGMRHRRETRMHRVLIGAQIAVAMSIAVSALLLSRSLTNIRGSDLGFATHDVLTVAIDLDRGGYSRAAATDFWRTLIDRAAGLPGVQHAAYAGTLPLGSTITGSRVWIEGRPAPEGGMPWVGGYRVGPPYFAAMGVRMIAGRTLTATDTAGIVIDEILARMFWPADEPASAVGRDVIYDRTARRTVVGVAARIATRDPTLPVHPHWYQLSHGGDAGFLVLRTASVRPAHMGAAVRGLLHAMDPDLPAYDIMTMDQRVSQTLADSHTLSALLNAFGAFAVVLACFGLYGLTSYSVSARVRELALRRALGARGESLVRLVLGNALAVAAMAVVVGGMLALWTSTLIRTKLYGVTPADPAAYGVIAVLLLTVTALAAALPAWRAARVAPNVALREE